MKLKFSGKVGDRPMEKYFNFDGSRHM